MSANDMQVPDRLPILSRGKHRSARKGACFMELASYLAGERWSDHPACTHPLLATLARNVNDHTSDGGRSRLAVLAPSVIGLTSDDLHVDVRIALLCARTALPVVSAERQRVMAVSILAAERVLASLDHRPEGSLETASHLALERAPHATAWARAFRRDVRSSSAGFRRHSAPAIVSSAVEGIARSCVAQPDEVLHDLLVQAIQLCTALLREHTDVSAAPDTATWDDACRLIGSAVHH